jgi:ABC-2 type transport system permease protein
MRSGTSFFDWTVFKKTICRFWPLWGAYSAIWLVMLPLNGLMFLQMDQHNTGYMEDFAFHMVPSGASEIALQLAVVFGALAAMAVFSHLYNARSANLFGSLPIRREGLFLTHYLAGLAFLVVPNLVIFLLTLLVELAGGVVCWQGLGFWLAVSCGEGFFFYSLAVFCGMFTGHILALPAFYVIFNFIVMGVTELLSVVFQAFYHGFAGFAGFADGVYEAVNWFTPIVWLDEAVQSYTRMFQDPTTDSVLSGGQRVLVTEGLGTVGIYALAALLLTVCAFFLYRARRLESAGDVVSVRAMRPVFKYGVALCAGLTLGMATVMFTGGGEFMLMIAILVWGVIGYFAAEMLLQKSFRVFGAWKGGLAVAAVFIAMFLVVGLDLTGFETRVPDPDQVDSVFVSGLEVMYLQDDGDEFRGSFSDPELIRLITVIHQEAAAQRDEERETQARLGGSRTSLYVTYTLKNGSTMSRRYSMVWVQPGEVDQEGAAAWALQQIYDNRELCWQMYGFDRLEEYLAGGGRLESAARVVSDEYSGEREEAVWYAGDASALLAAVKEDFFAGRLGARRVTQDKWAGNEPDKALCFSSDSQEDEGGYYIRIALSDTASSTLAAMEELADRAATFDTQSDPEGYRE